MANTYTVKPGDGWSVIAQRTGLTQDELKRLNPGIKMLHPNQKLNLSSATSTSKSNTQTPGISSMRDTGLDYISQMLGNWFSGKDDKSKSSSKPSKKTKFNGTYFLSDDDEYIRVNTGSGKGSRLGHAKQGDPFYKNGHAVIGHAANLVVRDDGSMHIYEYGRYQNPSKKSGYYNKAGWGNVQYKQLNGLNANQFLKKDGSLDHDAMLNAVSKAYFNNGSLSWRKTGQRAEETEALWDELGKNKNRSRYSGTGNNCVSTAARLSGAVGRPIGGSAGNDGFWVPIQGQAIARDWTFRPSGVAGNRQFMTNDIVARVWDGVPQLAQQVADVGNSVYNTGKNVVNWVGKKIGLKENGGSLYYRGQRINY